MTATVKVSRETGFGIELRRGRFDILVDGQSVGTVDHNHATDIPVEPGRHALRVRKGRYSSQERAFDAADGQVISFQCHGARVWPIWLASFVKPDLAIALHQD
jgi:hypothetical protein